MKVLLSLLFIFALFPSMAAAQRKSIALNDHWEFRQRLEAPAITEPKWYPAQVPGVVHTDLLRNKLIPDPFFRANEASLQWIENASWEYRSTVQVSSDTLKPAHVELVFEGIDGPAEIFLNDNQILSVNNSFREFRVDVKPLLKQGANQLLVAFPSPITAAAHIAAKDFWQPQTKTPEESYLRKPAYEYGWDWGPRFVLSGIWRPVHLDVWDDAKISDFHVRQRDISSDLARLVLEAEINSSKSQSATVSVDYEQNGKKATISRDVQLTAGINHVDLPLELAHPALWYPTGYGPQAMYSFHAQLKSNGHLQDEQTKRTGLRSIMLHRDLDKWGRTFEFLVNGIPVYGKGADVIPFDSFPTRVTTAQYRRILESAKAANMNMLRHWGGGYYETDEFYELCDELGIMIWQDFMFGNKWQPGTYDFKQNVEAEAEYQVKRLRDHPSVVLWCGNNETEVSWDWHRGYTNTLGADIQRRMWQDYIALFSGTLARVVERLQPEIPYWPSSPSADYEDTTEEYQSGDQHRWDVWHGRVPFSDYEKSHARFVTEFGFQSFPEMRTIESFTLPEDRTGIFTPVMLSHQKNNEGNSIIHDYMLKYYPEPKDFPSFLYVSQVLQAEGIKIGSEHFRRQRPRTMGSIYWQLNDCWPVASWSSIDYYGRWKALQYYARRFYNDVLVSPHDENGAIAVYVVSDKTTPVNGDLRLRLLTFDGHVLLEKKQAIEVAPLSSKIYLDLPKEGALGAQTFDPDQVVAVADFSVGGKVLSSNLVYLVPTVQVHLPAAPLKSELTKRTDGYHLRVTSPVLARSVYVNLQGLDADYSDNYFDLLPGQSAEIVIKTSAPEDRVRGALKVISLAEAFDSTATPKPGAPKP
ncbi:MAG TPA: glycoside hydrolase family 2 protein [Terriglobales bacterium]|nr:glycoside hydrolase family 2 protein [Terriglobales bacterium]